MRRQHTVVVSLGLALASSPALADDHLARVNEVLVHGSSPTSQFVEIEDPANETFSAGGYGLFVYESDGVTQAHFQGLVIPSGALRITVATADARTQFGLVTEGNAPHLVVNLAGDLPANGSACFRKSGVDLHCLSWGTATTPAGPMNGKLAGPAPADGESLQRQASGTCAAVGAPTPNAVNAVLPCTTPGTDAGTTPDAPSNGGPDGGNGPDGGGAGNNDEDGGGCCSTASAGNGLGFTVLAGMAVFGHVLRRRRRSA